MPPRIIVDTSVFTGALIRASGGANRQVLRFCLEKRCLPLMGTKLFLEFESVLSRDSIFKACPLSEEERLEFLASFLSVCTWISVHYLWRPNLFDQGDNHVLELAVAGGAGMIVTQNVRDFRRQELRFPEVQIITPFEFLKTMEA